MLITPIPVEWSVPRKKIVQQGESFGDRLAKLREATGLSQRALGSQVGLSQRMVAYYEGRAALPPGHVLSALSDALGATVDELIGAKPIPVPRAHNQRLWRRFSQIEKLPVRDRKELFSVIDAYLERNRLIQRAS